MRRAGSQERARHLDTWSQTPVQKREPVENGAQDHGFGLLSHQQPSELQHQEKLKHRNAEAGNGHEAIGQGQGSEPDAFYSRLTETSKSLAHSAPPLPNLLRPLLLVLWKPKTK